MPEHPRVRIFISSPSDLRPERLRAQQIIARLDREFAYRFRVEAVLWEREPLVAAHHFQDPQNIPLPRAMDIVVVILWSRLGVLLPEDRFRGPISGRPVTGTEWEFEDALAGARERGVPDLLLYRKTAETVSGLGDRSAVQQRLEQLDMVEAFISRWFRSADEASFIAASSNFASATEFEEKLYEHLRALLERRAGAAAEGVTVRWHEAPYRGLLSFEYEHAAVFFGRNRARNELRELLARREAAGCAFVLVLGASGSGKSSLVKAGLLPDLMLPGMIGRVGLLRWGVLRPSDASGDPLDGLAAAILSATALPELAGLHYTAEQLAGLLRAAPGQAALPIRQGLAAAGAAAGLTEFAEARLALAVDQLEELFTVESIDQAACEAFVAALEALARSGLVWVIATMRSDFFDRLETRPALASLSTGEARYLLLPPDDAEIGQIIRQPALEAGLRFEVDPAHGIGLDEVIRGAAVRVKDALPLLSFLLDQLWQRRGANGLLAIATYQELGGLEGAIGSRAEDVFLAQPEDIQKEAISLLRALVTVEHGTPVSCAAPLSLFPVGSARRALVDALLDPGARLLVADADPGGARLRLAHEALLTHWPRVREQIAADARDLELRGRLEHDAELWRAAPPRDKVKHVAGGINLAQARALVTRWGAELPGEIIEFVAASRRAARRRRWRLAMMASAAVIALPVIAGIVWVWTVWQGVRAVEESMAFVAIPAGCFDMGSPDSEAGRNPNEGPVHHVCPKAFDLGEYEVTQEQWRRVMVFPNNPDPSYFKGDTRRPVENVSWNDAQAFVGLMSFFGRHHYRLPSEAEWEYAARGGTTTMRYWGDRIEDGCSYENIADLSLKKALPDAMGVNCDDGYAPPAPVGSFKPNPFGLHDMLGNVAEWTADCYVNSYSNAPTDGSAVIAGTCPARVARGGSWQSFARITRAAYRDVNAPVNHALNIGFRLARTAP
jgi:formylglycine-generating enzyme required for sulfatase activity